MVVGVQRGNGNVPDPHMATIQQTCDSRRNSLIADALMHKRLADPVLPLELPTFHTFVSRHTCQGFQSLYELSDRRLGQIRFGECYEIRPILCTLRSG